MASLSIRKMDEETVARLRVQAARHGVSMEEEVRQIIRQAVQPEKKLGDLAVDLFGPAWNEDSEGEDFQLPARESSEAMEFSS